MIQITGGPTWLSVGWIIALLVLVITVVLVVIGQLDTTHGLLIGALAASRLL
jgi:hypothetical protein